MEWSEVWYQNHLEINDFLIVLVSRYSDCVGVARGAYIKSWLNVYPNVASWMRSLRSAHTNSGSCKIYLYKNTSVFESTHPNAAHVICDGNVDISFSHHESLQTHWNKNKTHFSPHKKLKFICMTIVRTLWLWRYIGGNVSINTWFGDAVNSFTSVAFAKYFPLNALKERIMAALWCVHCRSRISSLRVRKIGRDRKFQKYLPDPGYSISRVAPGWTFEIYFSLFILSFKSTTFCGSDQSNTLSSSAPIDFNASRSNFRK